MGLGNPDLTLRARAPSSKQRQFLFGPLDWLDLCLATKLGRAPLGVWLLLHLRWRMRGDQPWISLPNQRLREMGIGKDAKQRALILLKNAGLIRVGPHVKGKPTLVALVRVPA